MLIEHKQVTSSIFCAKNSTDMPFGLPPQPVRAKRRAQLHISLALGKSLNITEKIDCLSLVDTSFAPRDSPRQTKLTMSTSHPLSLAMGVSMIPNSHPFTRYCERHSPGRDFGVFNANQPVVALDNYSCPGQL